jgi:hypothetical protein
MSVFRSAITDARDGTVDGGYLALFWVMTVTVSTIPVMLGLAAFGMYLNPTQPVPLQDLGIGIGAVCTGFGVACGAVGAFRLGDKPRAAPMGTTTTLQRETIVTNGQQEPLEELEARGTPEKPLHVSVKPAKKKGK